MKEIYEEIFEYVLSLEIIDTHEHLPPKEELREKDTDVLKEYLAHYFNRDLISAGLKRNEYLKVIDNKLPLLERWRIVEPYWEAARNTGYGRSLDITVKELYGVDKISGATIEQINTSFLKTLKSGHYKKILKEKCSIKISLLDFGNDLDCDKEFFRSVYRMDHFIYPESMDQFEQIEREAGGSICSFTDWLSACEMLLDRALDNGAVALKNGLAYVRSLKYERTDRVEAEGGFYKILKNRRLPDGLSRGFISEKGFQDYMQHFILNLANKRGLVYQFHTGLQEGNGNYIQESNPALMTNLFLEYPDVTFDLFHIGYPYQNELSVLAKNFPNVMIDMCWAHIISPTASVNALIEWLDSVPANKISAFGGDYAFIDAVYGHQFMARENVSRALEDKVKKGVFDLERAKEIAKMLFYDNPYRIFKLQGKI